MHEKIMIHVISYHKIVCDPTTVDLLACGRHYLDPSKPSNSYIGTYHPRPSAGVFAGVYILDYCVCAIAIMSSERFLFI